MSSKKATLHLRISLGQVNNIAIIPSSFEWVDYLSSFIQKPTVVSWYREFKIVNGIANGIPVTICSTGNGGQSTAIAIEELAQCGTKRFLRIGSSVPLLKGLEPGDLVFAQGATTYDGVVSHYIPLEYPVVADFETLLLFETIAQKMHIPSHVGTVISPATFNHIPKSYGDLCMDLDCGTLYAVASALNVKAGCLLEMHDLSQEHDLPPAEQAVRVLFEIIRRSN